MLFFKKKKSKKTFKKPQPRNPQKYTPLISSQPSWDRSYKAMKRRGAILSIVFLLFTASVTVAYRVSDSFREELFALAFVFDTANVVADWISDSMVNQSENETIIDALVGKTLDTFSGKNLDTLVGETLDTLGLSPEHPLQEEEAFQEMIFLPELQILVANTFILGKEYYAECLEENSNIEKHATDPLCDLPISNQSNEDMKEYCQLRYTKNARLIQASEVAEVLEHRKFTNHSHFSVWTSTPGVSQSFWSNLFGSSETISEEYLKVVFQEDSPFQEEIIEDNESLKNYSHPYEDAEPFLSSICVLPTTEITASSQEAS